MADKRPPWRDDPHPVYPDMVRRTYLEHAPYLGTPDEYDGYQPIYCGLCRDGWPCADYASRHDEKDIAKQIAWAERARMRDVH